MINKLRKYFVVTRERDVGAGLPLGKIAKGTLNHDDGTITIRRAGGRVRRYPTLAEAIEVEFHFGDCRIEWIDA